MSNCIERIKDYLHNNSMTYPLLINIENAEQKSEIYDYCNVSGNTIAHVSDFAKKDCIPNIMALIDKIKKTKNNIFVFELTTYLRLIGNKELENTLQTLDLRQIPLTKSEFEAIQQLLPNTNILFTDICECENRREHD